MNRKAQFHVVLFNGRAVWVRMLNRLRNVDWANLINAGFVFSSSPSQQNEKESLLKERDHILSTLGETKQNLTGLCQQVCKEAALSQEQIQILAKYSSSDCPLSFLISEKEKSTSDGAPVLPSMLSSPEGRPGEQSSCYPGAKSTEPGCAWGPEARAAPAAAPEQAGCAQRCRQSAGISDVCQQMTDKCTTDE